MSQVSGTTDTFDLVGIAEDIADVISDISPTDTPVHSMARKGTASATYHQWQTDALAAAAANRQIEGDEASFTTATPTTMLANRTQISRKTLIVSRTADRVRKYGRRKETARLLVKYGKELKRDIEFQHVRNQASSAGGSGTARSAASLESMISGNVTHNSTAGTTPGYAGGDWSAPTDGTGSATLTEAMLKTALTQTWVDGGDASIIMCNAGPKADMAAFSGTAKFAGNYVNQGRTTQGVVVGGVDLYISDFGEHKVVLNRYMRDSVLFCLDPDHIECAWLDKIMPEELAKTGDATKYMLICEYTFVVNNPDAHAKIANLA